MKQMQADIIVVAAGPAGLAAAITARENEKDVLVFEKTNTSGGAANMGMGLLGIDTKIQRSNFNDISVDFALNKHMEYTHYRVDAQLVSEYFHLSADTIDWLMDMGVNFAGAFRYSRDSEATWHIVQPPNGAIGPRCASAMMKIMTDRAVELGAKILYETPVTDLIKENDEVCGVIARTKDGEEIEARAKAVLVCTGGFGSNAEMVKEELGYTLNEDIITFMVPGVVGDGLKMMWKAGAQKFGTGLEMIYMIKDQINYMALDAMFRQSDLMVNLNGERFMNEADMGNSTFTGNAISMQPGRVAYSILDSGIARKYMKNGFSHISLVEPEALNVVFEDAVEDALDDGYEDFFVADTIKELAEKLGIPADKLADTIETYNDYCDRGVDEQFAKPAHDLHPITGKGQYMAIRFYVGAYGTVGGVRINKLCEVLDEQCKPIPGLYSAGTDANTIYADSYNFKLPGNTMGFAINTGRMAANAMADYIDSLDD